MGLLDPNRPLFWFVWPVLAVVLLVSWIVRGRRRLLGQTRTTLIKANRELGTTFPVDGNGVRSSTLGYFGHGDSYCLFFDVAKSKVAITTLGGCWIKDIGDIREWQLHWKESSTMGSLRTSDHHFVISIADLNLPSIRARVRSMREGEDWNSRLGIIVNG